MVERPQSIAKRPARRKNDPEERPGVMKLVVK